MQRQEIKTNVAIRNLKGKMHTQTGISDIHPEHFCVILHMKLTLRSTPVTCARIRIHHKLNQSAEKDSSRSFSDYNGSFAVDKT